MKNKPHPRWAQKSPSSEPLEQQGAIFDIGPHIEPCRPLQSDTSSASSVSGPASPPAIHLSPVGSLSGPGKADGSPLTANDPQLLNAVFNLSSPSHSSSANSPRSTFHPLSHPATTNPSSLGINIECLFSPSSFEPTGFETGVYGHMLDHIMKADEAREAADCAYHSSRLGMGKQCTCINNAVVYNSLLELSIRLRKTVESFGTAAEHRSQIMDSDCQLYNMIRQLDCLTS